MKISQLLMTVIIIGCFPICLMASDIETPKFEVYGGYAYLNTDLLPPLKDVNEDLRINSHGFDSSVALNYNSWIGLVFDVSYCRSATIGYLHPGSNLLYLLGPRISFRKSARITPFFQTLFGGDRTSNMHLGVNNAFAVTFGGGADITVHPKIAIRVVQAEYLITRSLEDTRNNFRYTAGIVFKIGNR